MRHAADELLAMDQGHVVMRGTADVVLNDDRVIESYLGGSEAAVRRSGINHKLFSRNYFYILSYFGKLPEYKAKRRDF